MPFTTLESIETPSGTPKASVQSMCIDQMQMTQHLNAAMVTHEFAAFPKLTRIPAYKLTSARQQPFA
jgi:hypothetical protein